MDVRQVALVFCRDGSRVLLGQKRYGFGRGNVVAPGGHLDPGETARQAAARELHEEVGLVVDPADLVDRGAIAFRFPACTRWHMDVALFAAPDGAWSGTPRRSDELVPRWYPLAGLPLERMWDDAPLWVAQAADPEAPRVRLTVTYAPDNATVAEVSRGGRGAWATTTHDWSHEVDRAHLEHVRDHAKLYAAGGLRHLIMEVLAYAADEAQALGRTGHARVIHHPDGSVEIADDGRGTDTRRDADGTVVRKPVMATRDVRFFDADDPPQLPDGRPRRGMSTVAALCERLEHENRRAGEGWSQTYRYGIPDHDLRDLDVTTGSGTTVRLHPAPGVGRSGLEPDDLSAFTMLEVTVTPA